VSSVTPEDTQENVLLSTTIEVEFNEPMNKSSCEGA
jgi:hypothetical protein